MIYDGFKMGDEYWRMRVDDLCKDKENVWVIGIWFFTAADMLATHPHTK